MFKIGDQVGQDKSKHAAEADAPVPQHGSEGNVSDRADEGNDSDEWPDDRSPQRSQHRMIGQEEFIPEILRDPGGDCSGDYEAADDIHPDCSPVHDEVVADCSYSP